MAVSRTGSVDATDRTRAVIGGPQSSDSLNSSLVFMYGVAVNNNDLMSQLILQNIMNTQKHISEVWAMPNIVVL